MPDKLMHKPILLWYRRRRLRLKLNHLKDKVQALANGSAQEEFDSLLSQTYKLIYDALKVESSEGVLSAIQLLKAIIGFDSDVGREAGRIAAVVVACMKTGRTDSASYALDACKLVVKKVNGIQAVYTAKQLSTLAAVTYRAKNRYLLGRTAEYAFVLAEHCQDQQVINYALKTIKLSGLLAIKTADHAMLFELGVRLTESQEIFRENSARVADLLTAWLHGAGQKEDPEAIMTITDCISGMAQNYFTTQDIGLLLKEGDCLAGTFCLNPYSDIRVLIIEQLLKLAGGTYDISLWRQAVLGCSQVQKVALSHYGLKECFEVVHPSLVYGRKLFSAVTKLGNDYRGFRSQALFFLVRELVMLAEYVARQDMVTTTGDVIGEMFVYWQKSETWGHKSTKRFCQFMLLYWASNRRQAKKILPALIKELTEPDMLTVKEKGLLKV